MKNKVTAENFWNTDLEDIENEFLNGKKITDLPIVMNPAVPASEFIDEKRFINIDNEIKEEK